MIELELVKGCLGCQIFRYFMVSEDGEFLSLYELIGFSHKYCSIAGIGYDLRRNE